MRTYLLCFRAKYLYLNWKFGKKTLDIFRFVKIVLQIPLLKLLVHIYCDIHGEFSVEQYTGLNSRGIVFWECGIRLGTFHIKKPFRFRNFET